MSSFPLRVPQRSVHHLRCHSYANRLELPLISLVSELLSSSSIPCEIFVLLNHMDFLVPLGLPIIMADSVEKVHFPNAKMFAILQMLWNWLTVYEKNFKGKPRIEPVFYCCFQTRMFLTTCQKAQQWIGRWPSESAEGWDVWFQAVCNKSRDPSSFGIDVGKDWELSLKKWKALLVRLFLDVLLQLGTHHNTPL